MARLHATTHPADDRSAAREVDPLAEFWEAIADSPLGAHMRREFASAQPGRHAFAETADRGHVRAV